MARIVGDGALRYRHQLSLLADGEPDTAFERAIGGGQPHVGGLPVRRHDVGVVAVALGVGVGALELAQHKQSRENEKDQSSQCSPSGTFWPIFTIFCPESSVNRGRFRARFG